YPAGFQSTALIAGLTPTSNLPVYGMGIPDALGPLRYFQPLGSNQSTATSALLGGLNANVANSPSPSVDADGRIFLATFRIEPFPPGSAQLDFRAPTPAPSFIDNVTDMGDNLDALLFNGTTYPLNITVVPEPTSLVLTSLVAGGLVCTQ